MSPTTMVMTSGYPQLLEIDIDENVDNKYHVTFTTDSKHLISGGQEGVKVWRVKDGQQVAKIPVEDGATCVATSRDGRYIAAGSRSVFAWDATSHKQVFADGVRSTIHGIEFSLDSSQLLIGYFDLNSATIWHIAERRKVLTLNHHHILSAKYAPHGDRIATASWESVRVWDSNDGRLLVEVNMAICGLQCLLWCGDHLFVKPRDGIIKQINAFTGSTISEWPVPDASCIAMPQHGKLTACSTERTVAFLGMSAKTRPSPIQHSGDIRSIACSSDGQLLAIAGVRKIIIKDISTVDFCSILEPRLDIGTTTLDAWKQDRLTDAETLLSAAISMPKNSAHQVLLASRALVRARLEYWDAALVDAKESIEIQRSLLAYVARSVALIGKGKKDEGIRTCDIAFEHFHSEHVSLILLIKAVILFIAGDHVDAISRMNDLVTDSAHMPTDPVLQVVQAYMHLLVGDKHMECGDYEHAIQSFEDAQIKLDNRIHQPPLIVSLISGWRFDGLVITIKQRLCEAFLAANRTKEAAECVIRMLGEEIDMTEPIETWVSDFKHRCCKKLDDFGNHAVNAKQFDKAVSHYTVALSLDPANSHGLFVKRSEAYVEQGEWKDALDDAYEVIRLDPSSPSGYQRKYAALLGMGHHDNAIDAFETMLLKMSESSDAKILERSRLYIETREAIRTTIQDTICDSPLVLISTSSGRLCNKSEQTIAFESTPAFTRLIMSMTTHIDHALIEKVVGEFYRYATFSHTWEGKEPLYQRVVKTVVHDLEVLPTHNKLQFFCKIVGDEGFNWAWSDTCCIDKGDQIVLQDTLVSMFKWYEGSALTIIYLCDVDQLAEVGALTMSLWNSRAWTLLEYHASKVVRFYTKDWTPYLGLTIHNHKESPEIISEMEKATGISAQSLMALRPGLSDIREKLRLASTRQTTRVEDAAYSLLGIFSMTLPVSYGEGDKALGRLLSQLLMSSGDTSILAWTGRFGSFNSCLPADIIVFSQPLTSHIPPAIPEAEMAITTAALHASLLDLNLVSTLYDQLNALPLPFFVIQRMKLPCLAFKIRLVSGYQDGSELVFRVQAGVLGDVEIRTRQNLARLDSLYLVHPWIDFLLHRHAIADMVEIAPDENETSELDKFVAFDFSSDLSSASDAIPLEVASLLSSAEPSMDAQIEFLARLRQPFGALLLAPTRRNMPEYRRIATESLITAQVQEITSATLNRLIQSIRVLDML